MNCPHKMLKEILEQYQNQTIIAAVASKFNPIMLVDNVYGIVDKSPIEIFEEIYQEDTESQILWDLAATYAEILKPKWDKIQDAGVAGAWEKIITIFDEAFGYGKTLIPKQDVEQTSFIITNCMHITGNVDRIRERFNTLRQNEKMIPQDFDILFMDATTNKLNMEAMYNSTFPKKLIVMTENQPSETSIPIGQYELHIF